MGLKIATGAYTGNASDNRAVVTGLTFTPKVVLVACDYGTPAILRTDSMAGDLSIPGNASAGSTGLIESIDAAGFTISASIYVNYGGWPYTWIALGGTDLITGTYTGNGSDNRAITGVGISPGFVFIKANKAAAPAFRGTNSTGDLSYIDVSTLAADIIQSLDADGFTLGTNVNVNENGTTYYWFAVNNVSNLMGQGTYTGNDMDNRDITGLNFDPTFVMVKSRYGAWLYFRHTGYIGDLARMLDATGPEDNRIQSFGPTSFQVGSNVYVNNGTLTYDYWYFRDYTAAASLSFIPSIMQHKFIPSFLGGN